MLRFGILIVLTAPWHGLHSPKLFSKLERLAEQIALNIFGIILTQHCETWVVICGDQAAIS